MGKYHAKAKDQPQEPPFPAHYLRDAGFSLADQFRKNAAQGRFFNPDKKGQMPPELEREVTALTPNRWSSARRALLSNWIGAVLRATNKDRRIRFMDGVDPHNPLGLPPAEGEELIP